ncbi:MAG: hypothetical protein MUE44_14015 [Oscillatoriaceae cyanobacterium Prado104]|jgi:hypothetical protein|nr:hypothetical protein [Oscillatoriaceae cyanobacterium Prado104]
MNEQQMTQEQEALLDEAVKYARLAECKAKELWELGDTFAQKWEKRLRSAEAAPASKQAECEF